MPPGRHASQQEQLGQQRSADQHGHQTDRRAAEIVAAATHVEQHDDEQEEHHHGAGIDQHLNGGDELGVQEHVDRGRAKTSVDTSHMAEAMMFRWVMQRSADTTANPASR
jgi:hypothetical protein